MDIAGLQKAIDKFNDETLPQLTTVLESLVDKIDTKLDENTINLVNDLHNLLDRLSGTTITLTIPDRCKLQQTD